MAIIFQCLPIQISRQIRLSRPTINFATSSTATSCGEVRGQGGGGSGGGARRDGFDSGAAGFDGVREGGGGGDCWWVGVASKDYCGRNFAFKGGGRTILSSHDRNKSNPFFMKVTAKQAFKVIEIELSLIYKASYTKTPLVYTILGV
ncbi:hypothetical protein QJS10_CPB13g00875 [Acorus calamus]|uniref:DUF4220 domain-containing protein n=1 Tax=Acorus calamus TaxID=4465 RepID=A0AAV9DH97_ACOCL|nr:hypothetical protein QJS10_CPB13g00875 [Acorus calamus]